MALWGERPESESPATDLTDKINRTREAWRCKNCNQLMYLTDELGRPSLAGGAPAPKWGGPDFQEVCTLCFEMKSVLDSRPYWLNLHKEWMEKRKGRNKLKPGEDYFAS